MAGVVLKSVEIVRSKDGTERVVLDLAEFQALLDAASVAEHGLPNVKDVIRELRAVLASGGAYVDADEFLAEYDAAHP